MLRRCVQFVLLVGSCESVIRGVNLGGWLVLEQWIRPSLFAQWNSFDKSQPKDQWTFCEALGKVECKKRLISHWDDWVAESTFDELNEAGITHVRIPIGHWILGNIAQEEPYVDGEWPYFKKACEWALARDMQVWLDLHTAPGSQNGFDNSGREGVALWSTDQAYINRTLDVVTSLTNKIKEDNLTAVTGFGLLNEPADKSDYWKMLYYYDEAYLEIRKTLGPDVAVYIGDMFSPQSFNGFWHEGWPIPAENVYLDTHIYSCFVDDLKAMTPEQHIHQVCHFERQHIAECCFAERHVTELKRFVGEWTAAYDQTPSPEFQRDVPISRPLTKERMAFLKQYVLAQMMTYEATSKESGLYFDPENKWWHWLGHININGWFFWNFRMEADSYREWDYLRGVREGWIPKLVYNLTVDEQLNTNCRKLEEEAQKCTSDVVDPYPPLKNWVGVPCPRALAFRGERAFYVISIALVLVIVALLAFYRNYQRPYTASLGWQSRWGWRWDWRSCWGWRSSLALDQQLGLDQQLALALGLELGFIPQVAPLGWRSSLALAAGAGARRWRWRLALGLGLGLVAGARTSAGTGPGAGAGTVALYRP